MPTARGGQLGKSRRPLRQQSNGEDHDRGLIVERLGWTPEERLEANAPFVRFYLSVRPEGPLIRESDEPRQPQVDRYRADAADFMPEMGVEPIRSFTSTGF